MPLKLESKSISPSSNPIDTTEHEIQSAVEKFFEEYVSTEESIDVSYFLITITISIKFGTFTNNSLSSRNINIIFEENYQTAF